MKKITSPLNQQMQGAAVADLQDALLLLLDRQLLLANDEAARRELGQALGQERANQTYGAVTSKLVGLFQEERRLQNSGAVDEPTANAINAILEELGALEPDSSPTFLVVSGQVLRADGSPYKGGHVRAFDETQPPGIRLGEDTTDSAGQFTIRYAMLPGVRSVNLRVIVSDDDGATLQSSKLIRNARAVEIVKLMLPAKQEPEARVFGIVRDALQEPLDTVTVQAFDRDLRNEQLLGSTAVEGGRYEIRYKRSQFRNAKKESADLVIKVIDAAGQQLHQTPVQHNAPDELELDITVDGAPFRGPSEWETLSGRLTSLMENLSPLDLREDDQHQDISFLAGETKNSQLKIGMWTECFHLAAKTEREGTPLAPEVLFGFLRQGQPSTFYDSFLEDMQSADRMTLLEDKLLRNLTNLNPELQQSLLEQAIADNLIASRVAVDIPKVLETLQQIKLRYAADQNVGGGKGTIGQLLALTPAAKEKQTAFLTAFTAHTGRLSEFWKKLESEAVLTPETVQQVKLTFELGALTRNHLPLTSELTSRFRRGDVNAKRELAKLSREDWKTIFKEEQPNGTPIGVPDNIDGDDDEAKMEQFAVILEQLFERSYPTTSLSAKLARTADSPVPAKADMVLFLENNPNFQLDRYRVDQYVAENSDALRDVQDKEGLLAGLKSVQRVFKLKPTHAVVDVLLSRNIDSAQQIYFMGQGQFTTALADSPINKIDASKLYRKAENTYTLAMAMFGNHNMAINGATPHGVPSPEPDAETQAKIAALPNLQTLFGSLDYCECIHCRSVYSPAAYFVDVMRYLGERGTQGSGINAGKNVRQVLLERRPDLGEIELSCENTNTPLPYIDLVNEILEDAVAPPRPTTLSGSIEADLIAGPIQPSVLNEFNANGVAISADAHVYQPDSRGHWAVRDAQRAYKVFKTGSALNLLKTHQTFLSAAELRANPEYTNQDAYDKLKQDIFPINLPFDLWWLQTRTYLNHLGLPQPRLFELFQNKEADGVTFAPTDLQIDCAWLGITETERKILTGTLPLKQPWDYWGLAETGNNVPNPENAADPTENIIGTWLNVLGNVNVMLHRTGLTYKELLQALDMRYVNPDGSVFIFDTADSNAANCDTSKFTIRNLTEDVLNRLHRFIRLWRKLDGEMWELDLLLPDVDPNPNVINKSINDGALRDISRMNRLRAQTGQDWRVVYSLFNNIDHNLYFDRSQDGAAIQTLYQRLFRNKLVDAVASFPPSPGQISGPIADKVPGILAAFRINEDDLSLILADPNVVPTGTLNVAGLSRIYQITVLAKAVGLSIESFLRLKRLWQKDPFADPGATLKFIELAGQLAASAVSVPELDYLLAHRFTANSAVAFEDKAIVALLQAVREGLRKIRDDIGLKSEETKAAYVKSKLGLLPALSKDADQVVALSLIDGTWTGSSVERDALIETIFAAVLDVAVAKTKLAAIAGGLSPADLQAAVDQRFDFVQPELQAFLVRTRTQSFICEKIAEVLQLNVPSADALLSNLHRPGGTETLLQTINDAKLLEQLPDGSFKFAADETNFADVFKSLRLLHKIALTTRKLRIKADEVAWWLEGSHAVDMGWMHANDFPIDLSVQVPIEKWIVIQQFFHWKSGLPASELTALEFATNVLDVAKPSSASVADLAQLTGWDTSDINALAGAFNWIEPIAPVDNIKQELRKSDNLVRLADCMRALRRLGVNASRALEWARNPEPSAADAESLKQTVKAKYDLTQWQQVIKPLQDEFRELKRQALVSWLITHPNQAQGQNWSDTNGLYSYLLIDVEMSACMYTSRLKQASGSAQLFVQRCLLNLEQDILAKSDLDPKWKQWKWMKRYRVWEANRKVFLYPENWIEPELRDEKSPFFKDLENELMQNDVTKETAEQAYLNYLEKLDKVANLEIRAMHEQTMSQNESVLHVFGRSRSSIGAEHYYRKRINGARWTAWEQIDLDINANHLVAGIHNRRLYLLWPQFLAKGNPPTTATTPQINASNVAIPQPDMYWEIRFNWSELKKGKWAPKVLSDSFFPLPQDLTNGEHPERVNFRVRSRPHVCVGLYHTSSPSDNAPIGGIEYEKTGKQISTISDGVTEVLYAPANGDYDNGLIKNNCGPYYFFFDSEDDSNQLSDHFLGIPAARDLSGSIKLLDAPLTPNYTVIDSRASGFAPDGEFFVWNRFHTHFVDYHWHTVSSYSSRSRAWHTRRISSFRFFIHYHPFVELFTKELNIWGIRGLLNRRIQVGPESIPGSPAVFDFAAYQPDTNNVVEPLPVEDVDFTYKGAYAPYNWELFFHVPFFIANKLSTNQQFEQALEWFHYIFDPTSTDTAAADLETPQQKYWVTKPFYETTKADYYKQKIENIMLAIAKGDVELRAQVDEWRDNPFNPHLIARMRTVAYQKNVLIKYIQMLTAWADQLFRQDTIESMNEATQLYLIAASVLGPRPKSIPKTNPNPIKTYYQLQQEGIDTFGNVLKEVENLLPPAVPSPPRDDESPDLPRLDVLYFCIPHNENLLALWDTVADRLFKIRHCMNIEGVERQLALFEPAMLVKAAAGLDIGAALSDMNAPLPLYRFNFMIQRALEICADVKSLGGAMLAALEKRDAEAISLLRSNHERMMLDQVRMVKARQIDEALRSKESLDETRKVIDERKTYYEKLIKDGLNDWETVSLALTGGAIVAEVVVTVLNAVGTGTSMIPQVTAGASGFGGSPVLTGETGGKQVTSSLSKAGEISKGIANILQMSAGMTATIGGHNRRAEDWDFQKRLADRELPQVDKQIAAADIRHTVAQQELVNQDKQIENALEQDEFLRTKFTNQELFDWMVNQISTVYFQSYQLAYEIAKRAERCFRYELGLSDSNYIQYGYWDSMKKGLLSGEKLHYDLKRLETAYYEQNRREYELTKHVSLSQLDPIAMLKLRQNGECFVEIPETAFDMDYPGHYFRRIKTVSLSIPCVTGPYTTLACTLTMTSNQLRKDSTLLANKYARDTTIDDPRFRDEIAGIQSIATSGARNDHGMFELNFRDERYLPFEAAGAISSWHIKLNHDLPQFDYSTISDVVLHVNYTAREGGELLRSKAVEEFQATINDLAMAESQRGLFRVFDLKRDFSAPWNSFLHPATADEDQALLLDDLPDRLPYFTRGFTTKKVRLIEVAALMNDGGNYQVMLSPLGTTTADLLPLSPDPTYQGLHRALIDLTGSEMDFGAWTFKLQRDGATDFKSLPADAIEELFLIINYTIA